MSDKHDMGIPPYEPERDRELESQQDEEQSDESKQTTLDLFDDADGEPAFANMSEVIRDG